MRFTADEEALLSPFNAAAYDLLRRDSDAIQPCWLCMSDDARYEARDKLRAMVGAARGQPGMSVEDADLLVTFALCGRDDVLELWRAAELERKVGRANGDPRAFFMQNQPE